jgi:hypothetical protein
MTTFMNKPLNLFKKQTVETIRIFFSFIDQTGKTKIKYSTNLTRELINYINVLLFSKLKLGKLG